MTTQIQKPADLSPTVLHSPAEVAQWHAEWDAYREAVQAEQRSQQRKEDAEYAHANRIISSDEYYQRAVKEEAEKQAKLAAQEAERAAKESAKNEYMASLPDVAVVTANDPFSLITEIVSWSSKGYTLPENGVKYFVPGFYNVELDKPITTKPKSKSQ